MVRLVILCYVIVLISGVSRKQFGRLKIDIKKISFQLPFENPADRGGGPLAKV